MSVRVSLQSILGRRCVDIYSAKGGLARVWNCKQIKKSWLDAPNQQLTWNARAGQVVAADAWADGGGWADEDDGRLSYSPSSSRGGGELCLDVARLEVLPLALEPLEEPYKEPLEKAKEAHEVTIDE